MNINEIYSPDESSIIFKTGDSIVKYVDVLTVTQNTCDNDGLSMPYTDVYAQGVARKSHFHLWEGLSVIYFPQYNEDVLVTLKGEHHTLECISLHAFTDINDTLVTTEEHNFLTKGIFYDKQGDIFFIKNTVSGNAIVIISETPDYHRATIKIHNNQVKLDNGHCGVAIGFCKNNECEWLCREYYRHARKPKPLVAMSNTWGDRNGFSRVCRDFVMKEIDAGEQIGIDIVQIDDGWQSGSTADKSLRDSKDRRFFPEGFWELNTERFPDMKEISKYAFDKNIKVGLWFAPDYHDEYSLLERDTAVLKKAYDEWGFRFFKLDMFFIETPTETERFLQLLKNIYSFGDDVSVQLDVTRFARTNYLCARQYGTIFVENRYTKSANSFPYRVLKNLWMISRYIPSAKFQFELVNPDLNKDCYEKGDPFAPKLFDMDYLFASVMLSNPLFWMEMQFLSEKRKQQLRGIMEVWKNIRADICDADVEPIGEKPSGRSLTGFYVKKNEKTKYILFFREVTDRKKAVLPIDDDSTEVKILASNANASVKLKNGKMTVSLSKMRSYVLAEIL